MSLWVCHLRAEKEVADRYVALQQAIAAKQYERAYECMSRQYRADHTVQEFIAEWDDRLFPLGSGASISVSHSSASVYPMSVGFFELMNGEVFWLTKEDGQWFFTGETDWYID